MDLCLTVPFQFATLTETQTHKKKRLSLQQQWSELQHNHPQKKNKKKKKRRRRVTAPPPTNSSRLGFLSLNFFLFKDASRVCNSFSIIMQLWWRVTLLRARWRATYADCGLTVIAPALLSPLMLANVTPACCTNLTQRLQTAARTYADQIFTEAFRLYS